jgi:hypothetical protein
MPKPPNPRAALPVQYALLDENYRCRALTETVGGALAAFVDIRYDEDDQAGLTVEHASDAMWLARWSVHKLAKPLIANISLRPIESDDVASAGKLWRSEDEFVIWPRPARRNRKRRGSTSGELRNSKS